MTEPTKEAEELAQKIWILLFGRAPTGSDGPVDKERMRQVTAFAEAFAAQRVAETNAARVQMAGSDWRYKLAAFVTEILHGNDGCGMRLMRLHLGRLCLNQMMSAPCRSRADDRR